MFIINHFQTDTVTCVHHLTRLHDPAPIMIFTTQLKWLHSWSMTNCSKEIPESHYSNQFWWNESWIPSRSSATLKFNSSVYWRTVAVLLEIETLLKIKLNAMFLFISAFVVYDKVCSLRSLFIIFYSKHNSKTILNAAPLSQPLFSDFCKSFFSFHLLKNGFC